MRILIAVLTCHRFLERANSQRETWVQDAPKQFGGDTIDLRFFLGNNPTPRRDRVQGPDEIFLDVDDDYRGLTQKSRAMYQWAAENDYDYVYKSDDDAYVAPIRLLESKFKGRDYAGRLRGASGRYPAPYASGFGYWVSGKAVRILADSSTFGHEAEDRWVGNVLLAYGIPCQLDDRYVVVKSLRNQANFTEAPRTGNRIIAACEFNRKEMLKVHEAWKAGETSTVTSTAMPERTPFSNVSVLIKTFLRDGYLLKTIGAVQKNMPGMKLIVVDDGKETRDKIQLYSDLRRRGHSCLWLPFDSGFGAKANEGIKAMDRPFTLIGSDDFDFGGSEVAAGILKLKSVLEARPDVGSAAGRVDGNPYEGFIEYGERYIREIRLDPKKDPSETTPDGVQFYLVDITVNYNLVRSSLLGEGRVKWVENKIGGDHFDFYHDLRNLGAKVAWVPGVNIKQQRQCDRCVDPKYGYYRGRARLAIPGFLRKHGIERFIGFDGREDRLPLVGAEA